MRYVSGVIRFLIRLALYVAAAAIGLIVASLLFDGFSIDTLGFFEVCLIYAVVLALLTPLLQQQASKARSSLLAGGTGLIAVFVALVVTDLIADGLTISGISTWIGATVVVWVATLLASLLLPLLVAKRVVDERRERNA